MSEIYELKEAFVRFLSADVGFSLPAQDTSNALTPHYDYSKIDVDIREPLEGYNTQWVISALGVSVVVEETFLNTFITMLETLDRERIKTILDVMENSEDASIGIRPYVPIEMCQGDIADMVEDLSVGANYESVDVRFEGLNNLFKAELHYLNKLLEHASGLYNKDITKVKTEEIYLGFNTRYIGEGTDFFFTQTKVPATFENADPIHRSLLPISEEDLRSLMTYPAKQEEKAKQGVTVYDEIIATLHRINTAIQSYIESVRSNGQDTVTQYAIDKISNILIPVVVTGHVFQFSQFGGTSLTLMGAEEEDVNSQACAKMIDEVTTRLLDHLMNIPIPEGSGIDHFAIDTDSLGIYGRDEQNVVIQAVVDMRYQFATNFECHHSKSFLDMFRQHLKTVKNKYVFTQIGRIIHK